MKNEITAPLVAISRHRIATDGAGVTTLVVFHDCPLRCRWCLNPHTWREGSAYRMITPQQLLMNVYMDDIYFQATGGGITFGGGEPALRSRFIEEFRRICPSEWKINIETSLNVPQEHIIRLSGIIDEWAIDIKDMDPAIYKEYTCQDNMKVIDNLRYLSGLGLASQCKVRIPLIPGFNDEEDRDSSVRQLRILGFDTFDKFEYITEINK